MDGLDCSECGVAQSSLESCQFDCDAVFCDDGQTFSESCWNHQRQCAGCGRTGCSEHFDGLYCHDCRATTENEE